MANKTTIIRSVIQTAMEIPLSPMAFESTMLIDGFHGTTYTIQDSKTGDVSKRTTSGPPAKVSSPRRPKKTVVIAVLPNQAKFITAIGSASLARTLTSGISMSLFSMSAYPCAGGGSVAGWLVLSFNLDVDDIFA
ncbi:hypothetical protein TanjilG_06630 [Lupinus angustifolius]|uniref:Uncharacterized protein n=1 Tax=Lupinus angustifolius TaxID=3871 RepID=A0A1J7GYG1_LUPAN|nr:hypothetical protein TanjilG_06630 [Lupinus angustifolius]